MLQSIVSLHERVSKAKILTPKPLPIMKLSATRLESTGYCKLLPLFDAILVTVCSEKKDTKRSSSTLLHRQTYQNYEKPPRTY